MQHIYLPATNEILTRSQALARIKNTANKHLLSTEEIAIRLGGVILAPFDVPDGYVKVGPPKALPNMVEVEGEEVQDGWKLDYDLVTQEDYDAQQEAARAAQEAQEAQARQTRILGLVKAYGADVAIMGRLLAMFPDPLTGEPITFPCEASDVMTYIKGALAAAQLPMDLAPYAQTLETRYDKVKAAMTDAEIAAVAAILEGQQ